MLNLNIKRLSKAMFILGSLLFLGIMLMTLANISLRAFGENLRGVVEMTGYLGAASLGLCLPWLEHKKSHAYAGVFFSKLPLFIQKIISFCVLILSFGLTLFFSLELYAFTVFVHEGMELVDGFNIPTVIFFAALTTGLIGQSAILLLEISAILQKIYFGLSSFFENNIKLNLVYRGR